MSWWKSLLGTGATIGASALGGPAAGAAVGAGVGLLGNEEKRRKQQQTADLRAAEIEASPWTGRGPSTAIDYASTDLGDSLAGAANGFAMGQSFDKAKGPSGLSGDEIGQMSPGAQEAQNYFAGNPFEDQGMWGKLAANKPSLYGRK